MDVNNEIHLQLLSPEPGPTIHFSGKSVRTVVFFP